MKTAIAALCVLLLTVGLLLAPFNPVWKWLPHSASWLFLFETLVAIVFGLTRLRRLRSSPLRMALAWFGSALGALLALGFSWLLLLGQYWDGGLLGTEVSQRVPLDDRGSTVFVYETRGVPDGFESARVTYSLRGCPFEKTLFVTDVEVDHIKVDKTWVEFWLMGEKRRFRLDAL